MNSSSAVFDPAANFHVPCACSNSCGSVEGRRLQAATQVGGCPDPMAISYQSTSCSYNVTGCMDMGALNYLSIATIAGPCVQPVVGCMARAFL